MVPQPKTNWPPIVISVIVTALVVGGGVWYWQQRQYNDYVNMVSEKTTALLGTPTPPPPSSFDASPAAGLPASSATAKSLSSTASGQTPAQIAKTFYEQYPNDKTSATVDTYISPSFKQRVANNNAACQAGQVKGCQPADLYTMSQDWPDNPTVTTSSLTTAGTTATVLVDISDNNRRVPFGTLKVTLKQINGVWMIDNVESAQ